MYFVKRPNGICSIGEVNTSYYRSSYVNREKPGSIIIQRLYGHATSATPAVPTCYVVVKDTSYTVTVDPTISPGFALEDDYKMYADVYVKDDVVKINVLTQVYNGTYTPDIQNLAYVFPTGMTSDLTGFTKVGRISVCKQWIDDGGYLCVLQTNSSVINLYSADGSTITLNSTANATTPNVLVEFESVSKEIKDTINDINDTVSDLSSESAAKFVSR